jgi:uncharacterized tellurite resistance protein B-like protein
MLSILIPIACMIIGVVVGALVVGARHHNPTAPNENGETPAGEAPAPNPCPSRAATILAMANKTLLRVRSMLSWLLEQIRFCWPGIRACLQQIRIYWLRIREHLKKSKVIDPGQAQAGLAQGRETLRKCLERVNLPGKERADADTPESLCATVDPNALNGRARIGRQPKGDAWQSVLIIDICGTIEAPDDGHEVTLEVTLTDVTDDKANPLPALSRPKQGSIHNVTPFVFQTDMGKLCSQTTILEDWTAVAQISPEWFVLPRQGRRELQYSIAVISQATGDHLASTTCIAAYESIETGYLDVQDNIQRAKTLAVGLAFTVGAANGTLLEPEIDIIHGWVATNFGSADASESAQLELERALRKTATFFHRGGHLNLQEICEEIVKIAPMVGRLDILDLCLRVAAAKGQVTKAELTLLKDLAEWLKIDRSRLRAMVEKTLPVSMHQTQDAEIILGVTTDMNKDEARHQLNREYAKWSSRVISSDPGIRKQADQMLNLIANARTQYVGVKLSKK